MTCVELSKKLEKEKVKLQELQAQIASSSGRGHMQRFELWNILQPDIKATIKQILESEMEHVDESC